METTSHDLAGLSNSASQISESWAGGTGLVNSKEGFLFSELNCCLFVSSFEHCLGCKD